MHTFSTIDDFTLNIQNNVCSHCLSILKHV